LDRILEQFLTEAREHLEFLDKNLQQLEEADQELINALFRSAHTLKGSSALAGFEAIKELTHHAESILAKIRDGKLKPTREIVDALYDCFDYVVELVDTAEELGEIPEADEEQMSKIIKTLESLKEEGEERRGNIPLSLKNHRRFSILFPTT
jgi:two-component system chemotaxis sensor kinase CheA